MSGFEYSALDPGGREKHGVIEADTERHVRRFGLVGLAALLLTGGITITFLASALQALVRLV